MSTHASRRGFAALAIAASMLSGSAWAQGRSEMPKLNLGNETRGAAAVAALGRNLPAVAAHYRMSPARLQDILTKDGTSRLDRSGRLLFVEPVAAYTTGASGPALTEATVYDPSQAFALASKPGAAKVIYLDFDGHQLTGSAWNSGATINAQAYDTDGVPGSFSTAERDAIHRIWQRVSEDYAPFDVNVTTIDPGPDALRRVSSTDPNFGSRVVVTRNTFYDCSCGGVAYVGTYDYITPTNSDFYQPAWVFFNALGSDANVAEAASHEAGHNLGLSHDGRTSPVEGYYRGHGTGVTSWAPIMGVGYNRSLTQWSRGEYTYADNLQDDLVVIGQNGLVASADDVGNTVATAATLGGTAANGIVQVAQAGMIGSATDQDVFRFSTGTGTLTLAVSPAAVGANLDAKLDLLDSTGSIIASINPADGINATLSQSVTAGTYFIRIDGVGKGDLTTGYPDYGSLGRYSISGSYPQSGVVAIAPTAAFQMSATNGVAPLPVSVDASGSSDADGTIVSYQWNFGDGSTGTGLSGSKTYTAAGSYVVTLTVTDNAGLTATTSRTVTVTAAALPTMSVTGVTVSAALVNRSYRCTARVTVASNGLAVPGATVAGSWSGTVTGSTSALTASSGVATSTSGQTKKRGTCTYTVNSVTASGYTYSAPATKPAGGVSY